MLRSFRSPVTIFTACVCATFVAASTTPAAAQAPSFLSGVLGSTDAVQLPSSPAAWINSPPLTNEMLAGKAAYFYFFEETCPSCIRRWPEIFAAAKKFEGKPVVFIAVNSGTPRADLQPYVNDVGLKWPVIVDTDRSFEKALGVSEINLQNIYQAQGLMPDGTWQGSTYDLESGVPSLLTDAKWRVDPVEVPDVLKPAWVQVEFGNFASAALLVKRNLSSPKADVKAAAEKLLAAVMKELENQVAAAKSADDGGQKWNAYKGYSAVVVKFKGYEVPAAAHDAVRTLATDPAVRNELAAQKLWETAARQLSPAGPPSKAAAAQLQRIVTQHPDTEAGRRAQAALERTAAPPPAAASGQ
ncbi:MAG: TlpA family protein disulfide reductase [Planctomycetales bacterium]|nr:TlpA family protein disulfide reductase [Planctomycetales bacterium]